MTQEELRKIYNAKKEKQTEKKNGKIIITSGFVDKTFEDFNRWFNEDVFKKGCFYCGLTNDESSQLYNLRNHATRGGKRGKRLELDRKDPRRPYDELDNLVWCCYWCNNAKSNFFSEEEFIPIGNAIGKQLKEILNKQ